MTDSLPLRAGLAAIAFLTRVPVGRLVALDASDVARGAALFPLFGASGKWCGVSPFLTASDVAAIKAGGLYYKVE